MPTPSLPTQPAAYQIRVKGRLGDNWLKGFENLTAAFDGRVTTLTGALADQAALRGLLCWLWDLNLELISVQQLETEPSPEGGTTDFTDFGRKGK